MFFVYSSQSVQLIHKCCRLYIEFNLYIRKKQTKKKAKKGPRIEHWASVTVTRVCLSLSEGSSTLRVRDISAVNFQMCYEKNVTFF